MRHDSAVDIQLTYWRREDDSITVSDLQDGEFGGEDQYGEPVDGSSFDQMVQYIEDQGFWGFADTRKHVVHYWFSESNPPAFGEVLELFAHEIAHLTGREEIGVLNEERRGYWAGQCAAQAYELAQQLYTPHNPSHDPTYVSSEPGA